MKKIRQRNDIDIVVQLKNNEGVALDPTLCSDMTVYLTCGTKKFYINNFEKFTDGHIKFRFLAEQQTKLGVYNVTISAVTEDGRTFTTDACNAFNLVSCSCNAGDDAGEVNVESVEVDVTFEITAWGVISDIVSYDITDLLTDITLEPYVASKLNIDVINRVFGSPDKLIMDLQNKHVRFNQKSQEGTLMEDVIGSVVIGEDSYVISLQFERGFIEVSETHIITLTTSKTEDSHIFNYGQVVAFSNVDSLSTERIKDAAITSAKIANKAVEQKHLSDDVLRLIGNSSGGGNGTPKISGALNLTYYNSIGYAQDQLKETYDVAFYLITDSNGMLPSKSQSAVTISAQAEKILSFRSPNPTVNNILDQVSIDNFKPRGFNVGDIIALSRVPVSIDTLVEYLGLSSAIATALKLLGLSEIEIYQYKIWATNDAKWTDFINPDGTIVKEGVKGLMSPWDKNQVDKIPNLETTVNANDLATRYGYGTNFDNCLTTGVCAYSPANIGGVTENFTLVVQASSTVDSGGYYSIIQTAYGRTGSVYNRIFKRMIFFNPIDVKKELHDWVEITGSASSVFEYEGAPDSVYTALSSNGVNGQARIKSEGINYGPFNFTGDVFPFTDRNNDSLYVGIGFIYPYTYMDDGEIPHTQAEPATLIAPNGAVIIYRHTNDKITDLEARIKALEDKLV